MPVQFDFVWSTRYFPVYPVSLSCLDVLIKYYYLSLYPRLRVLVPPSCVHRDRRPVWSNYRPVDRTATDWSCTSCCCFLWCCYIVVAISADLWSCVAAPQLITTKLCCISLSWPPLIVTTSCHCSLKSAQGCASPAVAVVCVTWISPTVIENASCLVAFLSHNCCQWKNIKVSGLHVCFIW